MQNTPDEPSEKTAKPLHQTVKPWFQLEKRTRWMLFLAFLLVIAVVIGAVAVPRFLKSQTPGNSAPAASDVSLDSDGDGIPDLIEESGWAVSSGDSYVTNPNDADTDGDGVPDGEEAGVLISPPGEAAVYLGVADPTKADSDQDGLGDSAEIYGWSTSTGDRFFTDPLNPDLDGDGLLDGDEAGKLLEVDDTEELYVGFSNPELSDSDNDGLSDAEEADNGTNPYDPDGDRDGLDDSHEVHVVGSDPKRADTDGDGHRDSYEEENREALGLDPLFEDVEVSAWEYAGDFAKGALAGEAWPADSVAWLAGNLVSSGSSYIPGIGWIVGGVADARDAIASAIQADWVGAGFSAVGLVPVVGDAASIPRKAAAFVIRHPELAASVGALIVALNKVPESIKVSALKQLWPEWGTLRDAGASNKALLQLQKSGRMNLDSIGAAIKREGHIEGSPSPFLADGLAGEHSLQKTLSKGGAAVETQVIMPTNTCVEVCNSTVRIFDALVDGIAHESKVGFKTLTPELRAQIESDAYLIAIGKISGAHWHFYPSSHTNQIGASKPVLDLLEKLGIPFTIHVPITK